MMFNERYHPIVTTEEALLYDILQELKELNSKAVPIPQAPPQEEEKVVNKPGIKNCPYCGGVHENKGKFLACARKAKKKEGALK